MEEYFDVLDEKGNFTGKMETREKCHQEGIWHKAVVVFILNGKKQVLLQRRSPNKKLWPNLWDITAGGHVLAGEFGFQAIIRECQEELGITLDPKEISFLGASTYINEKGAIINKHFNEYYIATKEVDTTRLTLQPEEVAEVKWVDQEEITRKIRNNYDGITDKQGCWDYLLKYYEWLDKQ